MKMRGVMFANYNIAGFVYTIQYNLGKTEFKITCPDEEEIRIVKDKDHIEFTYFRSNNDPLLLYAKPVQIESTVVYTLVKRHEPIAKIAFELFDYDKNFEIYKKEFENWINFNVIAISNKEQELAKIEKEIGADSKEYKPSTQL